VWALGRAAGFVVDVLAGNLPSLLRAVLAQGDQLIFRVLPAVLGADAGVNCDLLDVGRRFMAAIIVP
jgi:hypothetical protein